MTNENRYVITQLVNYVLMKDPEEPNYSIDWEKVKTVAEAQTIEAMVYDRTILLTGDNALAPEICEKINMDIMRKAYSVSRKYARAVKMLERAAERGIRMICLKGCVIRDLYPMPEWRVMGDFDIYVSPESMEAAKKLFEEAGYTVTGKIKKEILCKKEKEISWEIACTMESEYKNSYIDIDREYRSRIIKWKYGQYIPEHTKLLEHIFLHTAKHLLGNGAGVRNLSDIALCMMNYDDVDYNEIKEACIREDCVRVYNALMNCVRYWFGVDISAVNAEYIEDDIVEEITEYMLSETIFGIRCADNRLMNWTLRRDEDSSSISKIFFPSLKLMREPYPYLKKHSWLLPAAWVQRAINAIFVQKISVVGMIKGTGKSIEYAQEHNKLMKKLGLISSDPSDN